MNKADLLFLNNCREILKTDDEVIYDSTIRKLKWEDNSELSYYQKFGIYNSYNLQEGLPIQTIRKQNFKGMVKEALWIYQKKSNNIKDLGSHIWDNFALDNGSIGPIYGYQMNKNANNGIDQINNALNILKTNPNSRNINLQLGNYEDIVNLPSKTSACITNIFVGKASGKLNLIINQRSCDMLVANNWDLIVHCILLHMLANDNNMTVGYVHHCIANAHIYNKHVTLVEQMINYYDTKPASTNINTTPTLIMPKKSYYEYKIEDFSLSEYDFIFDFTKKMEVAHV